MYAARCQKVWDEGSENKLEVAYLCQGSLSPYHGSYFRPTVITSIFTRPREFLHSIDSIHGPRFNFLPVLRVSYRRFKVLSGAAPKWLSHYCHCLTFLPFRALQRSCDAEDQCPNPAYLDMSHRVAPISCLLYKQSHAMP